MLGHVVCLDSNLDVIVFIFATRHAVASEDRVGIDEGANVGLASLDRVVIVRVFYRAVARKDTSSGCLPFSVRIIDCVFVGSSATCAPESGESLTIFQTVGVSIGQMGGESNQT